MPSKKIIHSLLNSITSFEFTPQDLSDKLLSLGLEISSIEDTKESLKGFVTAEVLTKVKHPDADKLSICTVNTGSRIHNVVCGAPNVEAGQIICFATVGTIIHKLGFKIDKRKIRGVESEGMICSEDELGIGESTGGILVLPSGTKIGTPLSEMFGDIVYDLDITPNRGDCLSHLGLAREISIITGNSINLPSITLIESSNKTSESISIEIENEDNCPRYIARIVKSVKISESPDWLKTILKKLGIKSRNNVIDTANYVMFLCGHPLHAFDYDKISGNKIIVKSSVGGEKFITLDNKEHILPDNVLLICDQDKPIALAGIMGGENTEISNSTVNVLIESAYFNSSVIRRGARLLGISSDASYRFERGADINITNYACDLAAKIISEISGGDIQNDKVDSYQKVYTPLQIKLRFERTKQIVGVDIPKESQISILESIGCKVLDVTTNYVEVISPSWRADIFEEIDLVEEVARIFGYENIPVTSRSSVSFKTSVIPEVKISNNTRKFFVNNGFIEIISMNFTDPDTASRYGDNILLKNALGLDFSSMRTSHVPNLSKTLSYNQRRGKKDIKMFEVGKAFRKGKNNQGDISGIIEMFELSLLLNGKSEPSGFDLKERDFDLLDAKGIIIKYFASLSIKNYIKFSPVEKEEWGFSVNSIAIFVEDIEVGRIGGLDSFLIQKDDIQSKPVIAVFDLIKLSKLAYKTTKYKYQSKFPSVQRDISIIVDKNIKNNDIENSISRAAGKYLNEIRLFDLYEGKNIPSDKKSMGYSLTFIPVDKTFDDTEIDSFMIKIIKSVTSEFNAELRS